MPVRISTAAFVVFLISILSIGSSSVFAQEAPDRLTLEDIHRDGTYNAAAFRGGRWANEGPVVRYVDRDASGASHLVSYNLENGERTRLIDGTTLFAPDVGRPIQIHDYAYSKSGDRVLIFTDAERLWRYPTQGFYYVYDLTSGELLPVSDREKGFQMFAKFDPLGERVAFVRNRNLYVVDLESMTEHALTTDGEPGTVINGTSD
ncbi:MAG: DPP IV N-terminal domain-containing protein, partial [Bacteroidota bacterium]